LRGSDCPANVREVADTVGVKVSYRLNVPQLHRQPAAGRRWSGHYPALHIEADDVPGEAVPRSQIGGIVLVPVCSRVKAGPLNLASQHIESAFLLDRRPIGHGTFFMLKVAGDSMTGAGIADGDWVVVRRQENAENGQIVVAIVAGEATVKTLRREPGLLQLMPQNPDYEPIPVDELTIVGTVVGVVSQA